MVSDAHYLLVVNNNKAICKILADLFQDEGFEVKTTFSSYEAIRTIRAQIPRAILIDYNMPAKNGLQTLKEVQGLLSGVPVVMVAANAGQEEFVEAKRKGLVSFFVSKPFNISSLVHLVTHLAPPLPFAQAI
jgi:DNA-binding NtrC family response regulator